MLLGKIDDSKPGRVSYVYDQYMFHYLVRLRRDGSCGLVRRTRCVCFAKARGSCFVSPSRLPLPVFLFCPQQVANNVVFLCMTDADAGSDRVRVPYAFLEDVKDEFGATYGDRAQVGGGCKSGCKSGCFGVWIEAPSESLRALQPSPREPRKIKAFKEYRVLLFDRTALCAHVSV